MEWKYVILGVIVVVGVFFSGCIEGEKLDINKVIEAQKNVKRYVFEAEIKYGGPEMPFTIPMSGKIDVETKKMYMNMSMMGQTMEMYIIGDEIYMKQLGQWTKMTRPDLEQGFAGMSMFGNMTNMHMTTIEVLRDPKTKIDVIGEETVDGVTCYKVKVVPDAKKLKELFNERLGMAQGMEYTLNTTSYIIYVDKATNFIKKEEMNFDMETSMAGFKMKTSMQMKFLYKDINKQIDIQLPEEAKSATPII